ncbi:MAG: SGNH/GDSL hydrolase family protein [Burkholderiaceae bacterium]
MPRLLKDVTLRQPLAASVGGPRVRLVVSNEHSRAALEIGRLTARKPGGQVVEALFRGRPTVRVAPGQRISSDPLPLAVASGERIETDLYLPGTNRLAGFHWDAREKSYILRGNQAGSAVAPEGEPLPARAFVSALLVESATPPRTVVAIGDSITDGNGSTPGAGQRWPDHLARRLAPQGIAVLNAGISGNRLLRGGMGEAGLARFEADVLRQPGVQAVIVLLGTNDIGWPGGPFARAEPAMTQARLRRGFLQLAAKARSAGVRVIGATLPPFEDALKGTPLEGHHSPAKESMRQELNAWIRNGGAFDGVIDFDAVLRDPARPARLAAAFDSGDHLHPGDAGYKAMADAIDLNALVGPAPGAK